tara:strand:+ start:167 stop:937 length:771 start_codon:yes stop_codon:yes gene_type:complete
MNRLYKRPMFRRGGSTGGGITSGLQRPGYKTGERVTEVMEEMRSAMPRRNSRQNFNNFLIDFGLDLGSRPPQGNILQTAAASAKDPFKTYTANQAGDSAFDDKLALGAYDIVKGEQAAAKEQTGKEDLIRLEADLNPKLKKKFREELDVVRVNEYADSLQDNDFDFIANNSMQIANDVVGFQVFKENNPEDTINEKQFVGILPYGYDKKGKAEPNYENISVGQVFYNPEDNFFYERIADEGIIETDFRALDPFTYE